MGLRLQDAAEDVDRAAVEQPVLESLLRWLFGWSHAAVQPEIPTLNLDHKAFSFLGITGARRSWPKSLGVLRHLADLPAPEDYQRRGIGGIVHSR